jgi:hypothetical protein
MQLVWFTSRYPDQASEGSEQLGEGVAPRRRRGAQPIATCAARARPRAPGGHTCPVEIRHRRERERPVLSLIVFTLKPCVNLKPRGASP